MAHRKSTVYVRFQFFLNHGEPIGDYQECNVDLQQRNEIAGFRYGIEGMCVGGRRRVRVSPHLAYGDSGCGIIPAKAVLVIEFELVEVQDNPVSLEI
ncbi:MAG: FKBP-type peptidyl-prolyl cis-trans isomerase [Chthonomonadales bacterium]